MYTSLAFVGWGSIIISIGIFLFLGATGTLRSGITDQEFKAIWPYMLTAIILFWVGVGAFVVRGIFF